MEAVRNYISFCIKELLHRAEQHDQTKLESPEKELFDEFTEKLRACTYASDEYNANKKLMGEALNHHYAHNRHHPEHHKHGIKDMTLIDLIEMLCDWKSSSMRHNDGNILKSIEKNQERFGYSDDLRIIFENTANLMKKHNAYGISLDVLDILKENKCTIVKIIELNGKTLYSFFIDWFFESTIIKDYGNGKQAFLSVSKMRQENEILQKSYF